jgi:hypothetical protein
VRRPALKAGGSRLPLFRSHRSTGASRAPRVPRAARVPHELCARALRGASAARALRGALRAVRRLTLGVYTDPDPRSPPVNLANLQGLPTY